eukprot:PLAT15890.2.p1 GENE.PLAT15890.2~~PLAT15890.2.p1  ORF type:complete len:189 (+),score=48.28 PLAT15890.2:69-635(+)
MLLPWQVTDKYLNNYDPAEKCCCCIELILGYKIWLALDIVQFILMVVGIIAGISLAFLYGATTPSLDQSAGLFYLFAIINILVSAYVCYLAYNAWKDVNSGKTDAMKEHYKIRWFLFLYSVAASLVSLIGVLINGASGFFTIVVSFAISIFFRLYVLWTLWSAIKQTGGSGSDNSPAASPAASTDDKA